MTNPKTKPASLPVVRAAELSGYLGAGEIGDEDPLLRPLIFVDLDSAIGDCELAAAIASCSTTTRLVIGVAADPVDERLWSLTEQLTCTLVPAAGSWNEIGVSDLAGARAAIASAVARTPRAALSVAQLLRANSRLPVADALVAESFAYSMLLAGVEFQSWLNSRPQRREAVQQTQAVQVQRNGDTLEVRLNQPARRNAFSRQVRDGLADAYDLAALDPSLARIRLSGNGPSFCSGGDLDEFGLNRDISTSHLIRLNRSVAARIHRCRDRAEVTVHGACIGAGIELASFASRLVGRDGGYFQLPELAMGLVPGAGGTVGVPRRIGRWRTAYLVLTGARIDVATALEWGLIDARG